MPETWEAQTAAVDSKKELNGISILVVGEGGFSFTKAFHRKHPNVKIIATAYESREEVIKYYAVPEAEIAQLEKEEHITLLFNVDATKLHEDPRFQGKHFTDIYFNFPHDGEASEEKTTTPKIVAGFFKSAAQLQKEGDKIHVALPDGWNEEDGWNRHAHIYRIGRACSNNHYSPVRKRRFSADRYPGYHHCKTGSSIPVKVATETGKQYTFERTSLSPEEIIQKKLRQRVIKSVGVTDQKNDSITELGLPLMEIAPDSQPSEYELRDSVDDRPPIAPPRRTQSAPTAVAAAPQKTFFKPASSADTKHCGKRKHGEDTKQQPFSLSLPVDLSAVTTMPSRNLSKKAMANEHMLFKTSPAKPQTALVSIQATTAAPITAAAVAPTAEPALPAIPIAAPVPQFNRVK
jgi:hypothetical protein